MTRQENILTLNEHLDHWKRLLSEKICDQDEGEKTIDALQNAIKALEQESCDDVVSRQAVLDALDKSKYSNEFCEEHHIDWSINLGMAHIVVNELKPVTPQQKMGQWEWNQYDSNPNIGNWHCSECHCIGRSYFDYCPMCGCEMQEVQNED